MPYTEDFQQREHNIGIKPVIVCREWLVENFATSVVLCTGGRAVPPFGYFTLYSCFSINLKKNMVKPKDVVNMTALFPSCNSVVYWYNCVFIIYLYLECQ
jgi:hypothetical protein